MADNAVHALQQRLEGEFTAPDEVRPSCHIITDQTHLYEACVVERNRLGWTQAEAEAQMGLRSERHLSKIEPARYPDWRERKYLRLPLRFNVNATGWAMLGVYNLVPALIDMDLADELAQSARPRASLTRHARRNLAEQARLKRAEARRLLDEAAELDALSAVSQPTKLASAA